MARLGGERRSQVPWLRELTDGCLAARPLGVNGRLRLVRWGAGRLFQGSPELRGSAAGGGHHVAGTQEVRSECSIC